MEKPESRKSEEKYYAKFGNTHMSRIGKKPIEIPAGVTVDITGSQMKVTGPKGELALSLPSQIAVKKEENLITVSIRETATTREAGNTRALWGLVRALVANMVEGVTKGYQIKLEIEGVGYKAEVKGKDLVLDVGFSHTVTIPALEGVSFLVEKNVITVSGIDKEAVGQTAAKVRKAKPVEPYKGKGIKYQGEYVRRKLGKRVAGATGAPGAK